MHKTAPSVSGYLLGLCIMLAFGFFMGLGVGALLWL
jgi:hypothetical protein